METQIKSTPFKLNAADLQNWLHNVATFGAPLILLFLLQLQQGIPVKFALVAVYAALLSAIIDILRKWIDGHKTVTPIIPSPTTPTEPLG